MVPQPYRIAGRREENYDTFTLELVPLGDEEPHGFRPGQFNMLYLFGIGEVPISISGDPARPELLAHTVRALGTVTTAMKELKVGDVVGLRGPYGSSWPFEALQRQDVIIVAGGIGLAPLRPLIHHLLSERRRYGRLVLLYGARTPGDLLFQKQLAKWDEKTALEVHLTVDRGTVAWRGNVGVVTTLIPRVQFDVSHASAVICGPEIMMRYSALELEKRGMARDQIYVSQERNMKCAVGFCGHCQFGPHFVCKDGPVFPFSLVAPLMKVREV
ncbi:MAG: FAD/NAD(P)-binding protein [Trueperaceae bacterium]|nr:MAG: FAD/NAD(P)-binding protein [Trueperaceae bacterium]